MQLVENVRCTCTKWALPVCWAHRWQVGRCAGASCGAAGERLACLGTEGLCRRTIGWGRPPSSPRTGRLLGALGTPGQGCGGKIRGIIFNHFSECLDPAAGWVQLIELDAFLPVGKKKNCSGLVKNPTTRHEIIGWVNLRVMQLLYCWSTGGSWMWQRGHRLDSWINSY